MGCSFYRVINGGILLSKSHSKAVQSASRWHQRGIFQNTDRGSTAIWYISLRKRYQSRCPNSFVQERTTTKFFFKWRSGRGKVNDWGQKVCESRSQGQRGRRRGLLFFHFTLIGMGGISVYSIYPFLSYWSMVCHEMFARRIIHGEDKIPTWSTRSSLIKALQPT